MTQNEWLVLAYVAPGLLVSIGCAWYLVAAAFSREPRDGLSELGAIYGCALMPFCWPAFAVVWAVEWLMDRRRRRAC